MSLPSPTLTVPTLAAGQMQFQGLVMGAGTPFGIKKLENIGKVDVRSGNTDRPRTRGAFVGTNLLKTRTPTVTMDVGPPFGSYSTLAGALAALRAALNTEGTTEYPLWMQLPGGFPLVCCMARVLKSDPPYDITAALGSLIRDLPIQFEATDPYFYAAPTMAPSIGLPTPGLGFSFLPSGIGFPLSFGGGTTANQVTVTNSGDVNCWPVLVITGPTLNPSVSNLSVAGNPTVTLDIQLNAGDMLMVDCDNQSILFTPAGQTVASPYNQILQAGSTFFTLPPNTSSTIAFNDQSTTAAAGTLSIWNASAYSGLT